MRSNYNQVKIQKDQPAMSEMAYEKQAEKDKSEIENKITWVTEKNLNR